MAAVSVPVEYREHIPVTRHRAYHFSRGLVTLGVRVPKEHFLKLQMAAAFQRRPMTDVILEWIMPHLEELHPAQLDDEGGQQ